MANLPGARQEWFTTEETDVLIRALKVTLYGDGIFFFFFFLVLDRQTNLSDVLIYICVLPLLG